MEEFNLFDLLGDEEEEEVVQPAAEEPKTEEPLQVEAEIAAEPEEEPVEEEPEEEPEQEEEDSGEEDEEEDESAEEEEEDEDGQSALFDVPKPKKAAAAKKPAGKKAEKKEEKKTYTGPRRILVYGQELWIENDPAVTLDTIRQRIVDDYQYAEFSKERTNMSLDENTGIVVPVIHFQKKG